MADFSDDFNRADSAVTLGASWEFLAGIWGISSNAAYIATMAYGGASDAIAVHDFGSPNVEQQITCSAADSYPSIAMRAESETNFIKFFYGGGVFGLGHKTGVWSLTELASVAYGDTPLGRPPTHGDVFKTRVSGNTFSFWVNDLLILEVPDITINAGSTKFGLCGFYEGSRWDNYVGIDLSSELLSDGKLIITAA